VVSLLLDTHTVLWWLDDPGSMAAQAREAIEDGDNDAFVSAAVGWEIAIKSALGKLRAPDDFEVALRDAGFRELPVSMRHALAIRDLPGHHSDPFDRIQVAQAREEGLTLVTRDSDIRRYDVPILVA
jgi:PIN domain nuclease of toxin-antitoxin system